MINLNVNLISLAVILWSGMLIIAGSIWVLSSQVSRLVEHLETESKKRDRMRARAFVRPVGEGPKPNLVRRVIEHRTTAQVN